MPTETRPALTAMEIYKATRALERGIAKAMKAHFTAKTNGREDKAAEALATEQALRAKLGEINPLAGYWSGSITASVAAKAHLATTVDLRDRS